MPPLPEGEPAEAFADWLNGARNDLQAPAEELAPRVTEALALLRRTPGILAAVMSGSGATCFGLAGDRHEAELLAAALAEAYPAWWIRASTNL